MAFDLKEKVVLVLHLYSGIGLVLQLWWVLMWRVVHVRQMMKYSTGGCKVRGVGGFMCRQMLQKSGLEQLV